MRKSDWKCPKCKNTLYVTNSARYWCDTCQEEKPAETVDPMCRDFVRNKIAIEYAFEQAMMAGVS